MSSGVAVPLEEYRRVLEADKSHAIKAVLVCHNETATGVTSSVKSVREILNDLGHPALLFVDGVSSIGSLNSAWKTGALMSPYQVHKKVSCSRPGWQLSVSVRKLWSRRSRQLSLSASSITTT